MAKPAIDRATRRAPASWIIRHKETHAAVMETFNPRLVAVLNTVKYEAVPIGDYLMELNANIAKGN